MKFYSSLAVIALLVSSTEASSFKQLMAENLIKNAATGAATDTC